MNSALRSANLQKIAILLLLASLIISLGACGSDSKDPDTQIIQSSQTPSPTTATETPQPEDEETITPTLTPTPTAVTETPQPEIEGTITPTPTLTAAPAPAVFLSDEGNYYKVVLDYTGDTDPYEMMAEYGQVLSDQLPGIQSAIDRFLYNLVDDGIDMYLEILGGGEIPDEMVPLLGAFDTLAIDFVFEVLVQRMGDVLPQLPENYQAELEGLASTLANSSKTKLGDGKLSTDEVIFYNIFPDVARVYQCSAIGVFGALSESGSTIVGRNFDLEASVEEYGSITEIRNSDPAHSIYLIGWLGNLNAYTAFNNQGIFGALVDTTGSMEPYSSEGIHSYIFDLRYALENQASIESVADYMSQPLYAFNHLIFLADSEKSQILENNISGTGSNMRRVLRSSDSELNPGIEWDIPDAIVAVSAFMLKGNHDNFTNMGLATERLQSYKTLIDQTSQDGTIGWDEIKRIQSYDGIDGIPGDMEEGDLYNYGTRRIVIFEPETFRLEVFFVRTPTPPNNPGDFDVIDVSFGDN